MKQKRTLEFKVDSFKFYKNGLTPKEAFVRACNLHGTTPSGCMTDYSASYMSDDIKNYLRKKLENGCEKTKQLLGNYVEYLNLIPSEL